MFHLFLSFLFLPVFGSAFFLMWFVPERTLPKETRNNTGNGDFLWTCPTDVIANNRSCVLHFENYSECHKTQEFKMQQQNQSSHKTTASIRVSSFDSVEKTDMPLFCYYIIQTADMHSNLVSIYTLNSLRGLMDSSRPNGSMVDVITPHDCLGNCSKISISFITKIGNDVTITWPKKYSEEGQTNHVTLDIAFATSFALLLLSRAFYASSTR